MTPAERLELARELITSLEPEQSPDWATAWKAELANRWVAYEAGSDPGVPFDEGDRVRALRASRDAAMKWRVRLLDGARREMRQAAANYEHERDGLGDRFIDEVAAVRNKIAALPEC